MTQASTNTLGQLVERQFGPQAQAYVTSAVHAAGPDLDWIEAQLAGRGIAAFLDVGCGGGHVAYRAAAHAGSVTACDPSDDMLQAVAATAAERGLANLRTAHGPAERLPFADAAFDAAATRFSAHHWGDLDAGLREVARVLVPGAPFLVVDSAAPGLPLLDTHIQAVELLRDPGHVRNYGAAEWSVALARAGFAVEALRAARLRIGFGAWVARMRTPDLAIAALRRVQDVAPAEVRRHFAIEADGSFLLDTLWIAGRRR